MLEATSAFTDARIVNSVNMNHQVITFGEFSKYIQEGKIVSVKEFLQRQLLKEEWKKDNWKAARDYIASVWKGTHGLDGFSVVPIELVIQKLKDDFESTSNAAYSDALELLNLMKEDGAVFLSLDGQSRGFLAMLPYVKGDIKGLGTASDSIMLEVDGRPNNRILKKSKYLDLPKQVKQIIDSRLINLTIVNDFYQFSDIIDTLVNKQKGWSWVRFQIVKQQNRFNKYVVGMIEIFNQKLGKTFTELWKSRVTKVKNDFKFNRDGHQNFAITMSTLFNDGQWLSNITTKLTSVETPIRSTFEKVFKYSNEFLTHNKNQIYISELINWNVFRWVLDGGNKSTDFYKELGFTQQYSIKSVKKLMALFVKHHIKIKGSQTKPHPLSWVEINGKWERIDQGYSHALENQSTRSIKSRMISFLSSFPFDEAVESGIIQLSGSMPSTQDVANDNNFSDLNGKELDVLDLSKYDRSHGESKVNGGSNLLTNLVMEESGPNRARGSKNI